MQARSRARELITRGLKADARSVVTIIEFGRSLMSFVCSPIRA